MRQDLLLQIRAMALIRLTWPCTLCDARPGRCLELGRFCRLSAEASTHYDVGTARVLFWLQHLREPFSCCIYAGSCFMKSIKNQELQASCLPLRCRAEVHWSESGQSRCCSAGESPLGYPAESVQKGSSSRFQHLRGPGWPRGMRAGGRDIELVRNYTYSVNCVWSQTKTSSAVQVKAQTQHPKAAQQGPQDSEGYRGWKNGTKPRGEVAEHMATEVLFFFLFKTDIFEHLLRARDFTRIGFLC